MFSLDADVFFESPRTVVIRPNRFGVLYLLRRDIDLCMGINPPAERPIAAWPGAMAMLAGIDLLAKFFAGSDETRGVGERFRMFLERFFVGTSSTEREAIYQLRNSLLHSFGLYSCSRDHKGKIRQEYRFFLTDRGHGALVLANPPDYQVDLLVLYQKFEEAVSAYCTALESDSDPKRLNLQANFAAMFPNHGCIHIG